MAQVLTYSPSDVTILLCDYQLSGIMSVTVQFNSTPFTVVKGIRGQHTRVYNSDTSAVVRIVVDQTSITNDILSAILLEDTNRRTGRLKFVLRDLGGNTHYESTSAFIPALPTVTLSQGFENREWQIELLQVSLANVGGNPGAGFDVFSSIENAIGTLGSTVSNAANSLFT